MNIDDQFRHDVTFAIADISIALRSINLALLALKLDDDEKFQDQFEDIRERTDKIWEVFLKLTGGVDGAK